MTTQEILAKDGSFERKDLLALLSVTEPDELAVIYRAAHELKLRELGPKVYFRGLVELSNICSKDCLYCGIRRSNELLVRYQMKEDEIVESALWAHEHRYGSVVLQSGEQTGEKFVSMIVRVLKRIKEGSEGKLGVTLCLGEQSPETYRRWFEAGAHRYLLRIETSNPELYGKLHPSNHSFEARLACLGQLREIGFQVGTGVMIGVPGQSLDDLAGDILFFKSQDIDMIGMGPYLVHEDTPLASKMPGFAGRKEEQLTLGLKMIAVTRLFLRDVNIASTTALQALRNDGRELGILAGANVIMPNITPVKYREAYQLYEGKPCLDEDPLRCSGCLARRIDSIGAEIGWGEWGDSPHAKRRGR